jgi:hypothetical protein
MSAIEPRSGEKRILQEDCAEDKLKNGILTLTNQRLIFEKTEGRMMVLSKKIVVDQKQYKFGVFNNSEWVKSIQKQQYDNKIR